MVTYAQLMASSEVDVARPILAEVASTIGDVQVRNRGTVGGNVCVADPTNHLPPLFAVLDATFTVRGADGERAVLRRRLLPGRVRDGGRRGRAADEGLGAAVEGRRRRLRGAHDREARDVRRERGGDASRATACGSRIGCVAATPVRATAMEEKLSGGDLSEDAVRAAADGLGASLDPPGDVHGSADYRRHLAEVVGRARRPPGGIEEERRLVAAEPAASRAIGVEVNGERYERDVSRAHGSSSTSSGTTSASQGRTSVATRGTAAPAPCSSTAIP